MRHPRDPRSRRPARDPRRGVPRRHRAGGPMNRRCNRVRSPVLTPATGGEPRARSAFVRSRARSRAMRAPTRDALSPPGRSRRPRRPAKPPAIRPPNSARLRRRCGQAAAEPHRPRRHEARLQDPASRRPLQARRRGLSPRNRTRISGRRDSAETASPSPRAAPICRRRSGRPRGNDRRRQREARDETASSLRSCRTAKGRRQDARRVPAPPKPRRAGSCARD